jgi:hypothetical protein
MTTEALAALAIILDFSGSMDQKLLDRTKLEIMAQNVTAISSTLKPSEKVEVFSFGSTPNQGCGHVDEKFYSPKELAAWVKKQSPKKFAATPLALAIRSLKSKLGPHKIKRVLIITDGNDTCGEDPCAALKDLNEDLKARNSKLKVDLLGYDLKADEKKKLDCGKATLSQVDFSVHPAANDVQFAKNLEKIEEQADAAIPLQPDEASLQIENAPAGVHFETKSLDGNPVPEDWQGPFPERMKPDSVEIKAQGTDAAPVRVDLKDQERKKIDFYQNFKLPRVGVTLTGPSVGFELSAADGTSGQSTLDIRSPGKSMIPPGIWRIKSNYPRWLDGAVQSEIVVEPNTEKTVDTAKLLDNKVKWIDPEPGRDAILIIHLSSGKDEKAFIPMGSPAIPVPLDARPEWQ